MLAESASCLRNSLASDAPGMRAFALESCVRCCLQVSGRRPWWCFDSCLPNDSIGSQAMSEHAAKAHGCSLSQSSSLQAPPRAQCIGLRDDEELALSLDMMSRSTRPV